MTLERLAVIYDADGGLLGELRYLAGKVVGTAHCAACDITHGLTGEKEDWIACKQRLGVEVEQLHRNELPPSLAAVVEGQLPCVAARVDGRWTLWVDRDRLEACAGRVDALVARIVQRMAA